MDPMDDINYALLIHGSLIIIRMFWLGSKAVVMAQKTRRAPFSGQREREQAVFKESMENQSQPISQPTQTEGCHGTENQEGSFLWLEAVFKESIENQSQHIFQPTQTDGCHGAENQEGSFLWLARECVHRFLKSVWTTKFSLFFSLHRQNNFMKQNTLNFRAPFFARGSEKNLFLKILIEN